MRLTILTLPISTNNLYAHVGRHRFMTGRAKANKEAIGFEARAQYRGKPLSCDLKAEVVIYWPTKRQHDVDNIKALIDACTGILWEDDAQISDLRLRKGYDKANPRVELSFEPAT